MAAYNNYPAATYQGHPYGQSDVTLAHYPTQDAAFHDAERGMSEVAMPDVARSPLERSRSNTSTHTLVGDKEGKKEDSEKPAQTWGPLTQPDFIAKNLAGPPLKLTISKWTLWQLWFNTYRKFFVLTTLLNGIFICLAIAKRFPYAENHLGALVLGNLLTSILVRNEIFGRFLYLIVTCLFAKWTPLWFRLSCTSILQHLGGVHSGCALSAFAWLLFKLIDIISNHGSSHPAVIGTGCVTAFALVVSIVSAFPWVRNNHHNTFERWHRFFGWIGLAVTWAFVIMGNAYDAETKTWNASAGRLLSSQELWFTIFITIFVLLPWVCVQKVEVEVEVPSAKVAVLKFKGGMQHGLLGRISHSAVMEYHAFGTISESMFADHHYMICGVQGDFTRSLVETIPTHIWTRRVRFAGVGNTSSIYRRGIRVCTGTGLGAALSTCIQEPGWFLIWIGSDQEKTFGKTISELIYRNIGPERRILWDSKKEGKRPDLLKLVTDAFYDWRAEVVMITSNGAGNDTLMQGLLQQGIPAFGTLWDF